MSESLTPNTDAIRALLRKRITEAILTNPALIKACGEAGRLESLLDFLLYTVVGVNIATMLKTPDGCTAIGRACEIAVLCGFDANTGLDFIEALRADMKHHDVLDLMSASLEGPRESDDS